MNAPAPITITPVLVADLHVEGERMPIYVHAIDRRSSSSRPVAVRSSSVATWRCGTVSSTALDPELVWLAHEHEAWRPGRS